MRNPILEKEKQNALLTGNLGKKPSACTDHCHCDHGKFLDGWMRKTSHISYRIISKGTVVQPDEIFHIVDQMSPLCQPGGENHIFFCFPDGRTVQDFCFNFVQKQPPPE